MADICSSSQGNIEFRAIILFKVQKQEKIKKEEIYIAQINRMKEKVNMTSDSSDARELPKESNGSTHSWNSRMDKSAEMRKRANNL